VPALKGKHHDFKHSAGVPLETRPACYVFSRFALQGIVAGLQQLWQQLQHPHCWASSTSSGTWRQFLSTQWYVTPGLFSRPAPAFALPSA